MSESNVIKLAQPGTFTDSLTEILRSGARHRQSGRDTRDALTRARAARPRQLPDEARAPEYRTSYFQRIIYV